MRIEAVLPPDEAPVTLDCRLYRTCLSLLETAHRYGYGKMENYQKKGMHDRIIPRDVYQDHYMVMREKYKHLVNHWQEETDPLKHVFEVTEGHEKFVPYEITRKLESPRI